MSDETLVMHCSPTLAGLKTANMFTTECEDRGCLEGQLRELNRMLGPKGLRIIPLRYTAEKALLYLYRPKRLREDLQSEEAGNILKGLGYPCGSESRCLAMLWEKLRSCEDFPHEIGLFLGYPACDVRGFIREGASKAKCTGYWQVYADEDGARETFRKYRKCTQVYCSRIRCGAGLEKLTVADHKREPLPPKG